MKIDTVRKLEKDTNDTQLDNEVLSGKNKALEAEIEMTDSWGNPTAFANRVETVIEDSAAAGLTKRKLTHTMNLNDDAVKAVDAMERESLAKARENETLTQENIQYSAYVGSPEFIERQRTVIEARGRGESDLKQTKMTTDDYIHRIRHVHTMQRQADDLTAETEVQKNINTQLEAEYRGLDGTKGELHKELGLSKYNLAKHRRGIARLQRKFTLDDKTQEQTDKTKQDAAVEEVMAKKLEEETKVAEAGRTKTQQDLGAATYDLDAAKRKTSQANAHLQRGYKLSNTVNDLNDQTAIQKAYNEEAAKEPEADHGAIGILIGQKQAQIAAENDKAAKQKAYRTAEDTLIQLNAQNAAQSSEEVSSIMAGTAKAMVDTARTEKIIEAQNARNKADEHYRKSLVTNHIAAKLNGLIPEYVTANADAIVTEAVAAQVDQNIRDHTSLTQAKDAFRVSQPGVYDLVYGWMPQGFDYNDLSVENKGLYNKLLEGQRDGTLTQGDVDVYNTALGCDIGLEQK